MNIKLFILFCFLLIAASCPAYTIFETFEYDVVSNTADPWVDIFESSAVGGFSYDPYGQYVNCGLQRNNLVNTTCWLYMNLGTVYNNTNLLPECWFEFDYRTGWNNANTGHSFIGLLNSSSRVVNMASSNYLYLAMQSNQQWNSACRYNTSPTAYAESSGAGTVYTWTAGQSYRVKVHIYRESNYVKIAVSLYQLGGDSGNEETLLVSNPVATMMPRTGAYLYSGINAIGIGNKSLSNSTSFNFFGIDNLYFSTDGPNPSPIAPFVRQPYQAFPDEFVGLVGLWRFDNPSNLAQDSSVNGNSGTVIGSCSSTTDAYAGSGAVQFNGGYIQLYSCSNGGFSSEFDNGRASMAAWIKLNSANPVWLDNGFANMGSWCYPSVYPSSSNTLSLKMFLSDGDPVIVSLPVGTMLTQWHHLAVTVDSCDVETGYKVYFDGELIGQFQMDGMYGTFLPADKPLIGACYSVADNAWSYMHGKIDELYIYNRVLTADEINSLVHFSDFDYSGQIGNIDLGKLGDKWLENCSAPDWCLGCDINHDTTVDFADFVYFAEQWMQIFPQ